MLLFVAGFGEPVIVSARSVETELGVTGTEVENAEVPFVGSVVVATILSVIKLKSGPGSNVAVAVACPLEGILILCLDSGLVCKKKGSGSGEWARNHSKLQSTLGLQATSAVHSIWAVLVCVQPEMTGAT